MGSPRVGLTSWGPQCKLFYSKEAKLQGLGLNQAINKAIPGLNLLGDMVLILFRGSQVMASMGSEPNWKEWFPDVSIQGKRVHSSCSQAALAVEDGGGTCRSDETHVTL